MVKRADGLSQIVLEPFTAAFINYSAIFLNKLHLVGTNFKLHSVVKRGLLLGLKFIPYPKAQRNSLSTLITTYTQKAKRHFKVAQASRKLVFKQNK
jgi:hypothetical protein